MVRPATINLNIQESQRFGYSSQNATMVLIKENYVNFYSAAVFVALNQEKRCKESRIKTFSQPFSDIFNPESGTEAEVR